MADSKPVTRPEDSLQKMIDSLPEKTGRSLADWKTVVEEAGYKKHGEMVKALKEKHGVSHAYANQIALRLLSIETNTQDPVSEIFAKRPEVKPLYDLLLSKLKSFGSDVDIAPKKGYVSVRRSKQFAVLQPGPGRLDVGIQLKGIEPQGRLEPSGSFNTMLSHRVKVSTLEDINDELLAWLSRAYDMA